MRGVAVLEKAPEAVVGEAALPVNVYARRNKLVVVAPMPGLEPEDIVVTIGGDALVIHGEMRGELQEGKDYLLHEWRVGPYIRAVKLPFSVDGTRTNVTYNNGILTVAAPGAPETIAHRVHLRRVGPTSGERVGFSGVEAHAVGVGVTERRGEGTTSRAVRSHGK